MSTLASSQSPIDLRSDTVTRPTEAMRAAMAAAPVGDDQYGEDPPTNALQERVAALLGKEQGLWLPSGTMANQVALRVLTRPGDEVIVSRECHAGWHETGGSAANSGVQLVEIGARGVFDVAALEAAIKPGGLPVYPPTTLVEIENTHNRSGGIVFPQDEVVRICALARARGIATFLDGARLWNASIASGRLEAELAEPFDLVAVSFSKGLGAPGGSLLAGSRKLIAAATRQRRMLGGAMRQTGFYAAAALFAVEHHRARLAEDHANARRLAEALASKPAGANRPRDGADQHRRLPPAIRCGRCNDARAARARARRARQCVRRTDGPRGDAPRRFSRAGRARGRPAPRIAGGVKARWCGAPRRSVLMAPAANLAAEETLALA